MQLDQDPFLINLKEYIPGRSITEIAKEYNLNPQNIIKLGSNENPWGASPKALETIRSFLSGPIDYKNNLGYYPDALGQSLVTSIKAKFPEIGTAEVITGNGMDNILEGLARLLLKPNDKVLIHSPTFDYYELVSVWAKAEPVFIQTEAAKEFKLDIAELISKLNDQVKIVFLCSPNNPTGNVLAWNEIKEVIQAAKQFGSFVFLDEAYTEYAQQSFINEVQNFDNLIVGRTFSKVYGLAALRIGWAVLPKELLPYYRKVQTPFAVNTLGLLAAEASLNDDSFLQKSIAGNNEGLQFLGDELEKLGFKTFESKANFISFMAGHNFADDASALCLNLLQKGIIVRNASIFKGAPKGLIRLTVGQPEQNKKVISCLKEILLSKV
jgi:histidinol-phosphate aminotransferase